VDEFSLIADIFAPLARNAPGAYGLTDDAACVSVPAGRRLVITNDMIVSGVHFLADDPPDLVGRKLLRINISDLAAMGATPGAYLLAIALPRGIDENWLEAFARGLGEDQAIYGMSLIGGDTVATDGPLTASLTALGEVRDGGEVLRSGAQTGDLVFVSGTLGDAALGLMALRGEVNGVDDDDRTALTGRFHLPQPRVALGGRLSGLASAAIDVSDGLVADLGHICDCSGVGAEIEASSLPLSDAARSAITIEPSLAVTPLTGGDDYEIVFTCPADAGPKVKILSEAIGLPITHIGRIVDRPEVVVYDEGRRRIYLKSTGYKHL
jgi:thiamine-monophosphate kinase